MIKQQVVVAKIFNTLSEVLLCLLEQRICYGPTSTELVGEDGIEGKMPCIVRL